MPITEEQVKGLQKQIGFYFSNSNIMEDKFLLGQVKSNEEGWVDLSVLCTFNNVKKITTDVAELAQALKGVEGLVVSEENTKVRRTECLPKEWNPLPRTIYAKGFPTDVSLDVLEEFFAKQGKVYKVNRRAYPGKDANGNRKYKESVHVEFSTEEEAKKAVEAGLEYNDVKLVVMFKEQHDKENADRRKKPEAEAGDKRKREEGDEEVEAKKPKQEPIVLPKDASVIFTKIGEGEQRWKVVKTAVAEVATARFCVAEEGTAKLMFNTAEEASKVVAKHAETPFKFDDVTPESCALIAGEDEEKFREAMTTQIEQLRSMQDKQKGGKKGGKGKGKGKGRKGGKGGKGKGKKN
eukprot:TRINITY_DN612_c0_g1_i4.p1 TRINITY_DN612_c0_g1~~TRINITY_DN612_c0_g1_i4.p1  ORF type:complete len:351 (+),score=148.61 TRINITY_DN612_c0_g1_i4:34-1086(+)